MGVVEFLEDILELAVVGLENGILGAHVHGELLADGHTEARVGKADNRFGGVVHGKRNTTVLGVLKHLVRLLLAARVVRLVRDSELTGVRHSEVHTAVLVTKRVAANADRLCPARNRTRNALEHDRLAEHGTAENVADSTIGREPHVLKLILLNTGLIRGDSSALHTDLVLLDRLCGISGDLVVRGITVLDTKVVVFQINVEVGKDELGK